MSRPLILYHANCADGFCAAWVAHRFFGDNADYLPVQYGQEPPDVKGRDLYILDFSYKHDVMKRLIEDAAEIVVLDHHKTAQAEFEGLSEYAKDQTKPHRFIFDMEKSGARLAWEQFYPNRLAPWLVDYVEDRDLWRWKRMQSKEVNAALASCPRTFAEWERISQLHTPVQTLSDEGGAILRYQAQQVDFICANANEIDLDGHKVLAVNTSVLFSEVAGKLAENRPFGAAWFIRKDGKEQWSLRSRDGGVDVSEIAKRHGGGGHRNAAGFEKECVR